jgi:hypothetical protein
MKVYNVEIFTNQFDYRSSAQISQLELEVDYLTIAKNKIRLPSIIAFAGDYIQIRYESQILAVGIVTGVKKDKERVIVSFKDFSDIFDIDVRVNLSDLTTGSMEGFIAEIITENYITNTDTNQNIFGLSVSVLTGTTGTSLDVEKSIVNLFKDVVYSAFLQYSIVIGFVINVQTKAIICTISKNTTATKTIETELSNVLTKNIDIGVTKESYNKLVVVNSENETEQEVYYLHTNNTINTTNTDRVLPVFFTTVYTAPSGTKTFTDMALEKAIATLKKNEYNNLIELEISNNDSLVNPSSIGIGQVTNVIDGTTVYSTILTGKRIEKTTTLIFGAVRKDLTKKLKWGL